MADAAHATHAVDGTAAQERPPSVHLTCTRDTFRLVDPFYPSSPADPAAPAAPGASSGPATVRWLDLVADYPLVLAAWQVRGMSPTRADWESWARGGYTYAAIVEEGAIQSIAAALTWEPPSPTSWELAAVWTREAARNRVYATRVCSFVTAHILKSRRIATCTTRNSAMIRVAERLGYRRDWRP